MTCGDFVLPYQLYQRLKDYISQAIYKSMIYDSE